VGRIAVEAVLGAALGAIPEVGGAYIGLSIDVLAGHEAGAGLSLGAALGAMLGVAPAVWLGGRAMGGDGALGWTLLGGAAGTGVAAAILAIKNSTGTLVIAALMPVIGSVVAYELSSHDRSAAEPVVTTVTVMPTFGPTSVGLAGTF